MTASVSEKTNEASRFVEDDQQKTELGYDQGSVPIYVAVLWVAFLASYVLYMLYYGLPDLKAWGMP